MTTIMKDRVQSLTSVDLNATPKGSIHNTISNGKPKSANPPYKLYYPMLSFLLDAILITASFFVLGTVETIDIGFTAIAVPQVALFMGLASIWLVTFTTSKVYKITRYGNLASEIQHVAKVALLAELVIMGLLYVVGLEIARVMLAYQFMLSLGLIITWRTVYFTFNYMKFTSQNKARRVLIVSSSERLKSVTAMIRQANQEYFSVAGLVAEPKHANYKEYVGSFDADIEALTKAYQVDDVVLAFAHQDSDIAREYLQKAQSLNVQTYVLPDYMDVKLVVSSSVRRLEDLNLVNVTLPKFNKLDLFLKRAFDIAVASLALFLSAPVLLMVAIAIKLESDGPILFVQERMGYKKQRFPIFKFRSMYVGADKDLEFVSERDEKTGRIKNHKHVNDPRVTRVGRFIRKTSLDELPQILNVLRGDMSLVGPRPEILELVKEYEPWQDHRFTVKQGITGWWQVNGRSSTPCHFSTHQDVEYINNYSFLMDIQILVMTIPALLKGKGAF